MADKFVVRFAVERFTKGAVRYSEQEERLAGPVIVTLYLRKDAYTELGSPEKLRVTIEREYE